MRPKHIKLTCLLSRNTCLCTKHQNMALKLKSLRTYGLDISPNPEVVGRSVTLDEFSRKLVSIEGAEMEYEEWKRVDIEGKKKIRIVKIKKNKDEFIEVMCSAFKLFLAHTERVTAQYKALHNLKENLPEGHAIIQMDFAENFSCQNMDEIQSAYWNQTQATLHPVVVNFKGAENLLHRNFVYVSDINHHNSTAVIAILKLLVPELKKTFPGLLAVHYWTDSPSSQYRNKFLFFIIANHLEIFNLPAH